MAELVTGEAVALDLRVARLPSRACALFIDLMLQLTLLGVFGNLLGAITSIADPAWGVGVTLVTVVLVIVGYPCAMETLTRGRTLGKLALGMRVVAGDGGPVRFRQALVRALAGFLEFWTLYGAPALIASLCSRRGRRLGDVFAGTIVIQERASGPAHFGPVAVMPPGLAGWAAGLELSRVPDDLAMTARQYLVRFWELLPEVRDELGARIAGQVGALVSPPPPPGWRPELVLSAVLAERRVREARRLTAQRAQLRRLRGLPPEPAMASGPPPYPATPGGPPSGPVPYPTTGGPAPHPAMAGGPAPYPATAGGPPAGPAPYPPAGGGPPIGPMPYPPAAGWPSTGTMPYPPPTGGPPTGPMP
ncbi:RDD family protein [Actinomadura rubteroloni]|uniref:RDD family protein n=1 Tax=Actinomadura rubteroloni TaxID=1926885 RepID=A0A2P4UPL6_9ACTN|nr:RDD family protein [Actinomadura rubteroloni]POM26993.1 RDD family protein [Actinomadura rubteroloni]